MPRRTPSPSYASWLAARSRNAMRRKMFAGVVSGIVFIAVLLGLIMMPRETAISASLPFAEERPDTTFVLQEVAYARDALANSDSALARARSRALTIGVQGPRTIDTVPPALRAERDTLQSILEELSAAMDRAASSPLPASFKALGETRALTGEQNIRVWLDSLDQIERLREPFQALGAGDPIYVSLTSLLNELGRSIRDQATERRTELRARIAPLMPVPLPPSRIEQAIDTVPILLARTANLQDYEIAMQVLNDMRAKNASIDSVLAHRRRIANTDAAPTARFAGALVIALFTGFALALALEIRDPRLSNSREAEVVTGVRVLSVIHPAGKIIDRDRRKVDADIPPLVDIVSDRYRVLFLHITASDAKMPSVIVTGPEPNIVSTIATNLAAAATYEASSTLLIDVDTARGGVAAILRLPESGRDGIGGLLSGRSTWTEAAVPVSVGRNRVMDVLVGSGIPLLAPERETVERVRGLLMKMEQRYDLTVVSAPLSYAQQASDTILPSSDIILCAHLGITHLSSLRSSVIELNRVGRRVIGIVLWDDDSPRLELV